MTKQIIVVDTEVHERLKALGKKGETYNDIIVRMLNKQEHKKPTLLRATIERVHKT